MARAQLVHPPNDSKYGHLRTGYHSYPPPSGLEILAYYVQERHPSVQIEVFDGNITGVYDIGRLLDANVIGISDWFTNHLNAMVLARKAKTNNADALVIIGGPNAGNLGERILKNHDYVDIVVCGDGEQALSKIIGAEPLDKIPNIWYREQNGNIRFTFRAAADFSDAPVFGFDHLFETDIKKYDSKSPDYRRSIDITPIPISSIRGCIKAVRKGACAYCSMPMNRLRLMEPLRVWRQIDFLNKKYGIRDFFETGDSFIVGSYPERLLKEKPKHLDISLRIYAVPDSITLENAHVLQELGVKEVFLGVETIDAEILSRVNKNYDITRIEESIELLNRYEIRVFLPFLFGLPGENKHSLAKSYDFALHLISKYGNVQRLLLSVAVPLVGTNWFNSLLSDKDIVGCYNEDGRRSLLEDDDIEYERLVLLSLHKYCNVSFSEIYEILQRPISGRFRDRIASFGCLEERLLGMENKILKSSTGR